MPGVSFNPDTDIPDLDGMVIIVTGSNVGLGFETVRQLAKHNPARIYLAARSEDKAKAAIKRLEESDPRVSPILFLSLDLSSFDSVKTAVKTFTAAESRLDILINNAGIMMTPEGLTEEGYEVQFGTNVMGPALFTQLLIPTIRETARINPEARVVNLTSASEGRAPRDIYDFKDLKTPMSKRNTTARYCISKVADIHYNNAAAERYPGIKFISVHPGMVATNLHHNSTGFFLKPFLNIAIGAFATPVEKGALSQIWAAVMPDAKTGGFYGPVGLLEKGSKASQDRNLREELWAWIQNELRAYL